MLLTTDWPTSSGGLWDIAWVIVHLSFVIDGDYVAYNSVDKKTVVEELNFTGFVPYRAQQHPLKLINPLSVTATELEN